MMLQIVLISSACLALVSCVSHEPSSAYAPARPDYDAFAARPTSPDWRPGSVWTFVTRDSGGKAAAVTFRVTDTVVGTCNSGVWRKLELLDGLLPLDWGAPPRPAWIVDGSFLLLDLYSMPCDYDDHIRGGLHGDRFDGDRTVGGRSGAKL